MICPSIWLSFGDIFPKWPVSLRDFPLFVGSIKELHEKELVPHIWWYDLDMEYLQYLNIERFALDH